MEKIEAWKCQHCNKIMLKESKMRKHEEKCVNIVKKDPNLSFGFHQALKRPDNYRSLSSNEQWEIDSNLGIIDWTPTKYEITKYKELR